MWVLYGDGAGGFGLPASGFDSGAAGPPLVADVDVLPGYGDGYFSKHVSTYPAADDLSIARRAYMAVSDVDQDGRTDVLFWKGMGVGIAFNRGCVP